MVSVKKFIVTVFSVLLLLVFARAGLAEVKVSIDPDPVPVNESFQLVFAVDYTPEKDPDFSLLQHQFTILGKNRSSEVSLIDGEYKRGTEWTLQLIPKKVGEFTIAPIRFDQQRSKPFQIRVKQATLTAVPRDELVLELFADVDEVYIQGQVLLTLRLLSVRDISAYRFGNVGTDSLDVVIEPLGDERQYQARIDDRRYFVRERQFALFPLQSGRLRVEPVMAEAEVSYDPFQTGGARRIRSRPLTLEVKPVPVDYRAAYWLPATRLELREDWRGDTAALIAGEPVTRRVTLVADGLTAAQLPQLELLAIDGVKQYPEQPGLANSHTRDGIRGQREQKVALIPGAAGVYRVPELRVPWWNLETGRMEVARLPARELRIAPAAAVSQSQVAAATALENQSLTLAPGSRFWKWLSLLLACGWAVSVFYWWNHSRRVASTAPAPNRALQAARHRLYDSCAANDATSARHALLAWGRALLAPRDITNLQQLGKVCGDTLMHEIEALDRSLYAKDHDAWHGGQLAGLCRRLDREHADQGGEQAGLMPLTSTT